MANTIIRIQSFPVSTQTLKMTPISGGIAANAAGYLLTVEIGTQTSFVATVVDALVGDYYCEAIDAGGNVLAGGVVSGVADTTETYTVGLGNVPSAADNATATRTELATELARIDVPISDAVDSATPINISTSGSNISSC